MNEADFLQPVNTTEPINNASMENRDGGLSPLARMAWTPWVHYIMKQPAHADVHIPKFGMPNPLGAGFQNRLGDPAGQLANYGLPLEDGREVHLKEYPDKYLGHWDFASAIKNPVMHIVRDSPGWLVAGAVGAIIVGAVAWALKDSGKEDE